MLISALIGSLSSKAIHNYVYGIQAWHILYSLPWVLHKEQINMVLKGATKLAPSVVKQDKHKPITMQTMLRVAYKKTPEDYCY